MLVPVADGSEEIESVTIIDVLVRAGMYADGRTDQCCVRILYSLRYSKTIELPDHLPSPQTRTGAKVTVASVMPAARKEVVCSRGVKLVADATIQEAAGQEWDLIVCPGGWVTTTTSPAPCVCVVVELFDMAVRGRWQAQAH